MFKNKPIVLDDKDIVRLDKIFENLKSYDEKSLKKAEKILSKSMTGNDKKKLFVFLISMLLETDFVKWEQVKNRISSLIKTANGEKNNKTSSEDDQKKTDETEFVELYINIGKDKRVFPRDLINFIRNSMKIDPRDIKNIRVHDKYSFFQIPKDMGDKAIILLSVRKFRGKNIVVNFSKHEQ